MSRQTQFKQELRDHARAIWEAHHALKALRAEADALDYGTTLETEDDEPTAAELLTVPYATNDAIAALMVTGHASNFAKVL